MGFFNIIVLAISFHGCIGGKGPYSICDEVGKVILVTKCGTCYCVALGYWGPWQACMGVCDEDLEATEQRADDQLEDQFRPAQDRMEKLDFKINEIGVQNKKQDYGARNPRSYKNKLTAESFNSYSGPVVEYEPEYYVLDY